ncbi:MAG: AMP-binding protein, partial [Halomonas sp.]|uniref:AMP-binding protein n=1 Tax=Halomonas sp. TaxID=1486246 RepID=UPI003F8E8BA9
MSESASNAILSGPALEGTDTYATILDVFHSSITRFSDKPAFSCMGRTLSYAELEKMSRDFAAWVQHETDLQPGDRIAVQGKCMKNRSTTGLVALYQ